MDRENVGKALGTLVSGIFIVTARNKEWETGFLGSWVQQCGFDPPAVSIAVRKGRPAEQILEAGGSFCVNVLADKQFSLMKHFGNGFALGEEAFSELEIRRGASGAPILASAMSYLDCRVAGRIDAGDHVVYVGHVLEGEVFEVDKKPEARTRMKGKWGFDY